MRMFDDLEPYAMNSSEFYETDSHELSVMMERYGYRLEISNVIDELGVTIGATSYFTEGVRLLPNFSQIVPEIRLLDQNKKILGECVPSNQRLLHNSLHAEEALGAKRAPAATAMLNMMEHMVGQLREENVAGYDLIMFYIRRGYVPVENDEDLLNSLADYVRNKTPFVRDKLPVRRLVYDPAKARAYWVKIRATRIIV